jgi:HEPN domain-containing protein
MKKPLEQAKQFLKKAAEDEALLDVVIASPKVTDEIFGFHCQQAAEKLLKALLSGKEVRFGKTHDLLELIALITKNAAPLPPELVDLDTLNPFAVEYRYDPFPESDPPIDRAELRALVQGVGGAEPPGVFRASDIARYAGPCLPANTETT